MNDYATKDNLSIKSAQELAYRRGYADGLRHRARQFYMLSWLFTALFFGFITLAVLRYA